VPVFRTVSALAFLLCVSLPPGARADFQKGLQAYELGDYPTAYAEWRPDADKGDPHAQHMLGFLYAHGRGVGIDPAATVTWWTRSARQGFAPAQYTLGTLYLKGLGVERDAKTAAGWIGRAADAGYADAQYTLGVMHATGNGVDVDLGSSLMWLGLAAATRGLDRNAYWNDIDKHLTPAQKLEAREIKRDWDR